MYEKPYQEKVIKSYFDRWTLDETGIIDRRHGEHFVRWDAVRTVDGFERHVAEHYSGSTWCLGYSIVITDDQGKRHELSTPTHTGVKAVAYRLMSGFLGLFGVHIEPTQSELTEFLALYHDIGERARLGPGNRDLAIVPVPAPRPEAIEAVQAEEIDPGSAAPDGHVANRNEDLAAHEPETSDPYLETEETTDMRSPNGTQDDFTRIKGLGSKSDQRLKEAGVYTYAQLAVMTPEEVAEILSLPSKRVAKIDVARQAAELDQ